MTLQELQHILDVEKWIASEAKQEDLCGKYERCRYCYRYEEYPCAKAHNRLIELREVRREEVPAWVLPEPFMPVVEEPIVEELNAEEVAKVVEQEVACAKESTGRVRVLTIRKKIG